MSLKWQNTEKKENIKRWKTKEDSYIKTKLHKAVSRLDTFQARKEWHDIFKVLSGKKKSVAENTLPGKTSNIQNRRRNKEICRQTVIKGVHDH